MPSEVHGGTYIPQPPPTTTFGSQIWVAVLSGAVAIVISGGAWIFSQGQNQAVIIELTRRIASVEVNSVSKNDIADIERRISLIESQGSPAVSPLRSELAALGQRVLQLETNIPRALSEANVISAEQNQKIATNLAQVANIERRIQTLENGSIPPLSDRLATLTANIAVLTQQFTALRSDMELVREWRAAHSASDTQHAAEIASLTARINAIEDQAGRLRDRVVLHEQNDARATQDELNRLHIQVQQRDAPTLGQPRPQ